VATLAILAALMLSVISEISGIARADQTITGTRVTGGGQFTELFYGFGLTTVTVHAVRHKDGTVTGQVEQQMPDIGVSLHGEVNCLHVVGNRAYVSGVITKIQKSPDSGYGSLFSNLEGTSFILAVEDNGEGRNAYPDQVSQIGIRFSPFDCADPSAQAEASSSMWLDRGNFQVVP